MKCGLQGPAMQSALKQKSVPVRKIIYRETPTLWQVYGVVELEPMAAKRNLVRSGTLPLDLEFRFREELFECGMNDGAGDEV